MFDDGFPVWLAVLIAIVAIALIGRRFVQDLGLERRIAGTPTSRIRSAAQGPVQIEGEVGLLPGPPIHAPLTLTPCVWYRYSIEEISGSGRKRKRRVVESGVSSDLFQLDDGTGSVIIDPDGARVFFAERSQWRGHTRYPLTISGHRHHPASASPAQRWAATLMRPVGFLGPTFVYTESLIRAGTPCLVYGALETQRPDPEQTRNRDIASLLEAWKREPDTATDGALKGFERDARGDFTPAAWARVRTLAERIVDHRLSRSTTETLDEWHLVSRGLGTRRLPSGQFLIACDSEAAILRRLRWHIAAGFLAFAAVVALVLWVFLHGNLQM